MMLIRERRSADEPAIRRLLTAAFDDSRVADLAEALDARADRPAAPLVAEIDGEPAGYVQLSRSWVDATPRVVDVLVLSPLGILPAYQRRGVGSALCQAALQRAEELGDPALFLEGDPAYYAKFGWERASKRGFTAPSTRIPDVAFQVVVLPSWQDWMTGPFVYNDTFWAMDFVGLRERT